MDPKKLKLLSTSLDRLEQDHITWKEFVEWFQDQGDTREQVHNAQMFHTGLTRMIEDKLVSLTNKRVEPKIEMIIPMSLPKSQLVLFVVMENKTAYFVN